MNTTNKCRICFAQFDNQNARDVHERRGHIRRANLVPMYCCRICNVQFVQQNERDVHERRGHVRGHLMPPMQASATNVHYRQNEQAANHPTVGRCYRCTLCRSLYETRALLHIHRTNAHRAQIGGGDLQPRPWSADTNVFEPYENEQQMQDIYDDNDIYILTPHRFLSHVKSMYNFPVDRHITNADLDKFLVQLYNHKMQSKAFKFNLAAGVILQNRDTGELRYVKAASNMTLLDSPIPIHDRESLRRAILRLQQLNIDEMIRNYRPNSNYLVKFITNLEFYVYNTKFPLKAQNCQLPDFVKKNKFIYTTNPSSSIANRQKQLCMFVALAQYLNPKQRKTVFHRALKLAETWVGYCQKNNLHRGSVFHVTRIKGVEMQDMSHFEECFQVQVNIYELHADKTASTRYSSHLLKFEQVLNLNIYQNHVNLILDVNKYCRAYACSYCGRICERPYLLQKHQSTCGRKTQLKFEGGAFKFPNSIFDQLEHVGVLVPEVDRYYPFFCVFDFEAILQKIHHDTNSKLQYTHCHIPVSVSISSNVPCFTKAKCFIEQDTEVLIEKMFTYLMRIRQCAMPLLHTKWGAVLDAINKTVRQRQSTLREECEAEVEQIGDQISLDDDALQRIYKKDPYCTQLMKIAKDFDRYVHRIPTLSFNGGKYDEQLIKRPLMKFLLENEHLQWAGPEDELCTRENIDADDRVTQSPLCAYMAIHSHNDIYKRPEYGESPMGSTHVIKRGNTYVSISNNYFHFLDVIQYLPPATSYVKFLKAYGIESEKQYFPYEYLDDFAKLDDPLPPYPSQGWYSILRDVDLLDDEHDTWCRSDKSAHEPPTGQQKYNAICQHWEEHGFTSLRSLLEYYNNCDCDPFVEAVNVMLLGYFQQKLDIFKIAVSIPGVARYKMFQYASKSKVVFPLFPQADADAHHMFKQQLCAGASLVITRYSEKNVTPIHPGSDKLVKSILGYDANSLYLAQLGEDLPSFAYVRRFRENDFRPEFRIQYYMMEVWLQYMAELSGHHIHTRTSLGYEVRVGSLTLDGYTLTSGGEKIAYYFHGCGTHNHINCHLNWQYPKLDAYFKTLDNERFLRKEGYTVISCWECSFRQILDDNPQLQYKLKQYKPDFYRSHPHKVTEQQLLKAIANNNIYGFALVDIITPPELKPLFDAFPPIFANHTVELKDLSPHMKSHVDKENINFKNGRRLLVTAMDAQEILLSTKLINWYMRHGIKVTKIHQVMEFVPSKPFSDFVTDVSKRRLQGARHADQRMVAESYKLIGNAGYGSLLLNKELFSKTKFVRGVHSAQMQINQPRFKSLDIIDDDLFEIDSGYSTLKMNMPIYLGFEVLQNAKIRLLDFVYSFLGRYIEPTNISLLLSDTDSIYFALTHVHLKDAVKPHLQEEFNTQLKSYCGPYRHPQAYLCRTCCEEHAFIDSKTPNLFKLEWSGDSITALCSKTYIAVSGKQQKITSKGIQHSALRRHNVLEKFNNVLQTQQAEGAINRGFRARQGQMFTYAQQKLCFPYLYCKRFVHGDGIHTTCLELVLNPVPKNYFCLQTDGEQLGPDFVKSFTVGNLAFHSIRQALLYYKQHMSEPSNNAELLTVLSTVDKYEIVKKSNKIPHCSLWRAKYRSILQKIVDHRMNQNPQLYTTLMSSGDEDIISADAYDFLGGCGDNYRTIRWCPEAYRRGRNQLGLVYSDMRNVRMESLKGQK